MSTPAVPVVPGPIAPNLVPHLAWRRTGVLVLLAAVVQTAVLGWMVWDRTSLLRHGREIVLPVTPVDPRDLFRGDYVILGYAVAQVPGPAGESGKLDPGPIVPGKATPAAALRPRTPLYATLEQQADGGWQAVASSRTHPGSVATNQVVLQGRTNERPWSRPGTVQLRYGIESYFVPEGQGRELEKLVRDKKIAAVIAIDAKGRAAIKGLMVDGKLIHRESPL